MPYPLPWNPKEVCGLTRWLGPEVLDASDGTESGEQPALTHRLRAFACAVLLRHAYNDALSMGGYSDGEGDTAAPMIASALALGGELVTATRRTLAAVAMVSSPEDGERGILTFGVLLCSVCKGEPSISGERLNRLAWAVIGEEQRQRDAGHAMGWAWLFSATFFNQRAAMWRSLARALLLEPARPHPKEADEVLRLIGAVACEG